MYYLIGLSKDGKLSLWDTYGDCPTEAEIEGDLGTTAGYTQLLLVGNGTVIGRYNYSDRPKLEKVGVWS